MAPSGMVHALELARQSLRPSGALLDLHPAGDAPPIEVRVAERTIRAGWLHESDGAVEYRQAEAALAQVVGAGLFAVERSAEYPFFIHADTLEDLLSYLADEWSDAVVEGEVRRRIESLLAGAEPDKEIIVRDRILARLLKPVWRSPDAI